MSTAKTISAGINRYRQIYGLPDTSHFHDAVHVMLGLGTGMCNELRVRAVEKGIEGADLATLARDQRRVFEDIRFHAEENREKSLSWAQLQAQPLRRREVLAFYKLGQKINTRVKTGTGKAFHDLRCADLEAMQLKDFDFSRDAEEIRARHAKPANERADRILRKVFLRSCKSWGAQKKDFPVGHNSWRQQNKRTLG